MFYGYDALDYNTDCLVKPKSINFYVVDVPLLSAEASKQGQLILALPVGVPYGVRTRKWSDWYPDTPFLGEMVSYTTMNDLGQAVETMIPYAEFDMKTVPWDDMIV
jgi:hypothetical protein